MGRDYLRYVQIVFDFSHIPFKLYIVFVVFMIVLDREIYVLESHVYNGQVL